MNTIKLSILVLTVPSRLITTYPRLMLSLQEQTKDRTDVEILALYDNKKRTVGAKRQALHDLSQGEYLVFIDDDDEVAPNYIKLVMDTLYQHPGVDCVLYGERFYTDSSKEHIIHCTFGLEFPSNTVIRDQWYGRPSHTTVYKSEIAKRHKWENVSILEDVHWIECASKDLVTQFRIDAELYYYNWNPNMSETHGLGGN